MTTTDAASVAAAIRAHLDLQPGERLYTVVDACQDAELAFEAESRFHVPIRMLFKGEAAQYMREVAPYFIPIDPQSEYLESWAARWGNNVGIFLASSAEPNAVFRHLRDIFVVKDEEGQEYFFRFYDPRVLRPYLATCTPAEAQEFAGPIRAVFCETETGKELARFALNERGFAQEMLPCPPA
jgi:hypothetical protein